MTTEETISDVVVSKNFEELTQNMEKLGALHERLVQVMARRSTHNPALDGPGQGLLAKTSLALWQGAMQNPANLIEQQMQYWAQTLTQFAHAQQVMSEGKLTSPINANMSDRRFANPLWDTHPYFNYVKQQYQINSQALNQVIEAITDLTPRDKQRLTYFTRQITDMICPTNFLATNPDALEKALETQGQSLLDGLENLISDLEANNGEFVVKLADDSAFELGRNIAATPGQVVFRNKMMELIQYVPATPKVRNIPLIIFPPWINKYYVLDLKPQNSLIKWLTEQGYTVFVVSWINPDPSYRDVGMEEYITDGYLAAINTAKRICGTKQVNAVGYCIAGTTLSLTLSLLKQRADKSVRCATLFTTLTDFSEQGEFVPFLQDDFVDGIEYEAADKGILPSTIMARTFSFLRSNDLIYTPAIRSYMLGETPPAFDLLYWNGDGSNLPGKMAVQYLRGLCQNNAFANKGFELLGHRLHLSDVSVPVCAIACETDHIAACKDSYRGLQQMGSKDKTFIMAQAGHIAGIVNPPGKKKYGHYTNNDLSQNHANWAEQAQLHEGSWWPRWEEWLGKKSGKMVPARVPDASGDSPLEAAPGTYVRIRSADVTGGAP